MGKGEIKRFIRFFIKDTVWLASHYGELKRLLEKQEILSVKPYKFTRWHVGFCYFTGTYKNKRVFIKTCIGKYDTIDNESKMRYVDSNHIPRVICSNTNGIKYVVNEFIQAGDDLSKHSHEDIVKQSVEILDILYENGIINRDVNPENLYLDKNGSLILIDFGWAVFTDENLKKSKYSNIESMLNKKYRNKDGSFDDAYSFYVVLSKHFGIDEAMLSDIKMRIGRLRIG